MAQKTCRGARTAFTVGAAHHTLFVLALMGTHEIQDRLGVGQAHRAIGNLPQIDGSPEQKVFHPVRQPGFLLTKPAGDYANLTLLDIGCRDDQQPAFGLKTRF